MHTYIHAWKYTYIIASTYTHTYREILGRKCKCKWQHMEIWICKMLWKMDYRKKLMKSWKLCREVMQT